MKRRDFIKIGGVGSLGAFAGFPMIVPSSALGRDGSIAPSNRVCLGGIGLGTQGTSNLINFRSDKRVQITALCDVNNTEGKQYYGYSNNGKGGLRNAQRIFGEDIATYDDFREVLGRDDIDAVMLALPDHWHAFTGMAAVRAGKDVFGEKPLTRTIREGKALRDCVLSSGRIWQTGSWQRSLPDFVHAAELVRNGYLGRIKRIEIGLPANFKGEVLAPEPVPEGFNWEMWQGPAPRAAYYNPRKTFTRWRGIRAYSAGKIADWGAHHLDIAHWAVGIDKSGASEIAPSETVMPIDGFSDQPTHFKVTFYYGNALEIEMSDSNKNGVMFYGTRGKLFVSRQTIWSDPIGIADIPILPTEDRLFPVRPRNHFTAFIDSVIDRRPAVTDIEVAHRTNTGCLLGEIAYILGRNIRWDPKKEEIVSDSQAARLCDRSYAAPWQLSV